MINRLSERAFRASLASARGGALTIRSGGTTTRYGDVQTPSPLHDALEASLVVDDPRFFRRAVFGSDIGIGESFMDGDWSSPTLVDLIRLMLRNAGVMETQGRGVSWLQRALAGVARRLRDNSLAGSRHHIHKHYDLGNDFFRLFLDDHLMYSSAFYEAGDETLEQAQQRKLARICAKLDLSPRDHVLEIGTGWGGFAVWAATQHGCRVTTTTISQEQYRYARDWAARSGEPGSRIEVLLQDYRELKGRFDKIVSIEMFEAVGLKHYDEYFAAIERLLAPNGSMLLQTITVDEQYFPRYQRTPDWIEKYIFPGGELASIGEILKSLARISSLSIYHAENIGRHYARTLHAWRDRFHRHLSRVRAMGFSEQFVRMWDLYLAYCEAAFLERHAGVFQLVLNRNYTAATLFNEPRARTAAAPAVA